MRLTDLTEMRLTGIPFVRQNLHGLSDLGILLCLLSSVSSQRFDHRNQSADGLAEVGRSQVEIWGCCKGCFKKPVCTQF